MNPSNPIMQIIFPSLFEHCYQSDSSAGTGPPRETLLINLSLGKVRLCAPFDLFLVTLSDYNRQCHD